MSKSIKKSNNKLTKKNKIITRERTSDSINVFSENNDDVNFDRDTFRQLSSKLKVHVYNPTEVSNEIEKNLYIVPANRRRTSEVISEFEFARVVGERAQQIQNGAPIFVETDPYMTEIDIAKLEIKLKQCPLIVRRMYNDCVGEEWAVNEMEIPF